VLELWETISMPAILSEEEVSAAMVMFRANQTM
jgi:hypothetical protein